MTLTIPNLSSEVYDRVREFAERVNLPVEDAAEVAIRNSLENHIDEVVRAAGIVQRMGRMSRESALHAAVPHDLGKSTGGFQSVAVRPGTPADDRIEPLATEEISAPFELELSGPREKVVPRDVGAPRLEFWFDEDKATG